MADTKQRGRIGIRAILLLGLGAIIVVFGFIFFASRQDATSSEAAATGDTFANAIIEGNPELAYSMLTEDLQNSLAESYWQLWLRPILGDQANKSAELTSQSNPEDLAEDYAADARPTRLVYRFRVGSNIYTVPIVVVLNNGEWKVDKISGLEP